MKSSGRSSDGTNASDAIDVASQFLKLISRDEVTKSPNTSNVTAHLMHHHRQDLHVIQNGTAFHYSDAGGLLGMAQSRKFWATSWDYLNDPSEGVHGIEMAIRLLSLEKGGEESFAKLCPRVIERLKVTNKREMFVVSFCRNGDLLSQWRGYGSFGRGYAIGFDIKKLRPHPQVGWLIQISYDDERLKKILISLADIFRDHCAQISRPDLDDLAEIWSENIRFVSESFKHSGYREEEEMRLVFRRGPGSDMAVQRGWEEETKYRARGAQIIPYIATGLGFADCEDLPPLPITEVVIGPGLPPNESQQSVSGLLNSTGHIDAVVRPSIIPFRD